MKTNIRKHVIEYTIVVALAVVMAFNYILFVVPNSFAPSGINGVATMVQYKLHFSIGWFSLIINVPLCVFAFFCIDRPFAVKTFVFCLVYSGAYLLLQQFDLERFQYNAHGVDTIFPCLIAGLINGGLYGVCFRINGSTGGTDVISKFVSKRNQKINFFWITFAINAVVAAASFFVYAERVNGQFVYDYRPVVLCILYSFVTGYVGNLMLKGSKTAYKFFIVSEHTQEIEEEILHTFHRSATRLTGNGAYSHVKKEVLLCVVGKHQVTDFQAMLKKYDKTFAFVETVNQTIGNFANIRHVSEEKLKESGAVDQNTTNIEKQDTSDVEKQNTSDVEKQNKDGDV